MEQIHSGMLPETIKCPHCGAKVNLDEEDRKVKRFECPGCKREINLIWKLNLGSKKTQIVITVVITVIAIAAFSWDESQNSSVTNCSESMSLASCSEPHESPAFVP